MKGLLATNKKAKTAGETCNYYLHRSPKIPMSGTNSRMPGHFQECCRSKTVQEVQDVDLWRLMGDLTDSNPWGVTQNLAADVSVIPESVFQKMNSRSGWGPHIFAPSHWPPPLATTIPEHQSVGCSTLVRFSPFSLAIKGIATLRGSSWKVELKGESPVRVQ